MWYFIGCGISLGAYICVNYGYCYHLMQVRTLLSSLQFSVMKIPVRGVTENLSEGMLWQNNLIYFLFLSSFQSYLLLMHQACSYFKSLFFADS